MSNESREVKRYRACLGTRGVIYYEDPSNPDNDAHANQDVVLASSYDKLAASHAELVEALEDIKEWCENAKRLAGVEPYGLAVAERALTRAKAVGESV